MNSFPTSITQFIFSSSRVTRELYPLIEELLFDPEIPQECGNAFQKILRGMQSFEFWAYRCEYPRNESLSVACRTSSMESGSGKVLRCQSPSGKHWTWIPVIRSSGSLPSALDGTSSDLGDYDSCLAAEARNINGIEFEIIEFWRRLRTRNSIFRSWEAYSFRILGVEKPDDEGFTPTHRGRAVHRSILHPHHGDW